MIVTKAEFETNPSRYLDLVGQEEIIITSEGEYIARLTDAKPGAKPSIVDTLMGLLPSTVTDAEVKRERYKNPKNRLGELFGQGKGEIWMAEDFDAPLEDFKEYM